MTAAEYLREVEARAERATKGPWERLRHASLVVMAERMCVASCGGHSDNTMDPEKLAGILASNARFIAESRTDIPRLCRMLRVAMAHGLTTACYAEMARVANGEGA